MEKNITCIVCPMGCRMKVTKDEEGNYTVEGNTCKRGEKYGVEEMTCPKRVVTTTVKIRDGALNLIPVKTNDSIPKELIFDLMELLDEIEVSAPVNVGDIIVENVLNTGVNIVASRNMDKVS
ncbi:DUF1667 domain-containing protein [Tepidibacter formicigenes]|jgi:CxxC motif-containing protein|uniref:CxxC motif-containing protein n=1 Tax=Tepidibacter formicigenes DSM 15518 TaxID=1123349 RepID=A0A1M6PRY6_9FIRM|nr:DUF1667 domain-containing protein [Tepidibacter formicigenes]SHK10696.1 CxxC motif-containing protein [Tepidibacter formicigenes DSM 15518]